MMISQDSCEIPKFSLKISIKFLEFPLFLTEQVFNLSFKCFPNIYPPKWRKENFKEIVNDFPITVKQLKKATY